MPDDVFSRALFMCHAPIVIPPLGGSRAASCRATSEAMANAARALVETKPDRVVVLDPHLILLQESYSCVEMPSGIQGSFRAFGRPDLSIEFPKEPAFYNYLTQSATDNHLPAQVVEPPELDHGAMVPLWFLQAAGYTGPVCIIGYPWRISQDVHTEFGRFLRQACARHQGRTALIASGDMSHRLQHGAPSGYHPRAHVFDEIFTKHVMAGELLEASRLPVDLRDLAAEDASESMAIAAGALGGNVATAKLLSYEAPFGVGYLVAELA